MKQLLAINPPVIAHRGASQYAPENTLSAFLMAKELGVKWIEFDVQLTADEALIIFHDDELNRTTNGKGELANYALPSLKTLDAGSWFNSRFNQEKIPTFEEALHFLQHHDMAANIELKARVGEEKILATKVIALLEKYLKKKKFPFLISSFSPIVLSEVRQLNTSFPLGLLMHEWMEEWKMFADELNCVSVHLNQAIVDPNKIEDILSTNRQVLVYTVNQPEVAKKLFSLGVHAVFSDCPDRIICSAE